MKTVPLIYILLFINYTHGYAQEMDKSNEAERAIVINNAKTSAKVLQKSGYSVRIGASSLKQQVTKKMLKEHDSIDSLVLGYGVGIDSLYDKAREKAIEDSKKIISSLCMTRLTNVYSSGESKEVFLNKNAKFINKYITAALEVSIESELYRVLPNGQYLVDIATSVSTTNVKHIIDLYEKACPLQDKGWEVWITDDL